MHDILNINGLTGPDGYLVEVDQTNNKGRVVKEKIMEILATLMIL